VLSSLRKLNKNSDDVTATDASVLVGKLIGYHRYPKPVSVVMLRYYMTSSVSGQSEQILRCDWLPELARWRYLALSPGLPAVSRKKNYRESHVNPLLTKLVRSRWLDIGLVFFCVFMDRDGVEVHKHTKTELGHLTEQAWSITNIY